MRILSISSSLIDIPPDRQRQEWSADSIVALATSISSSRLVHPLSLRAKPGGRYDLVAGWRRRKALEYLWNMGQEVKCGRETFPPDHLPAIDLGTLTNLEAYELELVENIDREDLSWQDKARATSRYLELKRNLAHEAGEALPTHVDIAEELRPGVTRASALDTTKKEVILARYLNDEDVAKAPTLDAGYKIVKRKEELKASKALGLEVGKTFSSADHELVQADCTDWLRRCEPEIFDVILTDPPYGMSADEFGDSGGKAKGEHFYDDSLVTWRTLVESLAMESFRITKPQAHLYVFCDIERFAELKLIFESIGWAVFRTPIIWYNPTSNRAPWPEQGPMRKWQMILYAVKGKKLCNRLAPDFIAFPSDPNLLNHHAAKPVQLFKELLSRSVKPGDRVLDPFCGSGPIFPACHELKVKATGIELDSTAYGMSVQRLGALK